MAGYKFPDEVDSDNDNVDNKEAPDNEVEVEIVDDTPVKDRGREPLNREVADPTDEEINSYSDGVQKRIKELTHARHDERRAKEALLREKKELERLAEHMANENKKLKTEAAKNFRPAPLQANEVDVQTQQTQVPRQELDDKTVRWQAKNRWFGSDGYEEVTSFALGLHQKLVNSGVDPRSDDYFERIDARMKSTFPDIFGETEDKPRSGDGSKRPTSVVAPATRSTGAKKVQLTPTQVALAKKYGLTPQQYAAEVAKLERSNG